MPVKTAAYNRFLAPNGRVKPLLKMVGEDGNAFSIIGRARQVMRRSRWTDEEIQKFTDDVSSGDYNHLLARTMDYVIEGGEDDLDQDEYLDWMDACREERSILSDESEDEEEVSEDGSD